MQASGTGVLGSGVLGSGALDLRAVVHTRNSLELETRSAKVAPRQVQMCINVIVTMIFQRSLTMACKGSDRYGTSL